MNVNTVLTQRTEHTPACARAVLHAISYHGNDGEIRLLH